jgi:hypothetical protein
VAYLQDSLEEGVVVYCSLPPGYEHRIENGAQVANVVGATASHGFIEKPVYSMAQSGRRWQRTLFP